MQAPTSIARRCASLRRLQGLTQCTLARTGYVVASEDPGDPVREAPFPSGKGSTAGSSVTTERGEEEPEELEEEEEDEEKVGALTSVGAGGGGGRLTSVAT